MTPLHYAGQMKINGEVRPFFGVGFCFDPEEEEEMIRRVLATMRMYQDNVNPLVRPFFVIIPEPIGIDIADIPVIKINQGANKDDFATMEPVHAIPAIELQEDRELDVIFGPIPGPYWVGIGVLEGEAERVFGDIANFWPDIPEMAALLAKTAEETHLFLQ